MSIKNSDLFQRLLDGTKIYYSRFSTDGTHFKESKEYQNELIEFIDKYVDRKCDEALYKDKVIRGYA